MKKYDFTSETRLYEGRTLHRIVALKDFSDVKKATSEDGFSTKRTYLNMANVGYTMILSFATTRKFIVTRKYFEIHVLNSNQSVSGNAKVENSHMLSFSFVSENAHVCESVITDCAQVFGNASVDLSRVSYREKVCEDAIIANHASIEDFANISGNAEISNSARIGGGVKVYGFARVSGDVFIRGRSEIKSYKDFFVFSTPWRESVRNVVYTKSDGLYHGDISPQQESDFIDTESGYGVRIGDLIAFIKSACN